ncbi:MAG: DUF4136 domain-containing protein [Cyclobacteriaceae bacterium]|nr:DUF4136 domain-containing protein [Cyclobacteriaceae bacterium]MDH4296259.1 DUF4136 domain-containing protein [Cyclobacteriaceae bacterium]MDH5249944.1 DUF4136 domain-containing protein [Cyclobacteriaceae bacterium]
MKRNLYRILGAIGVALLVMGCYPSGPEYIDDLDVVYTKFDEQFDFQSKGTFALPDAIVVDVKIKNGDTTWVYMKDVYALPILASIEDHLQAQGWERVGIDQNPDMVVTPAGISSTTYFYSYWYDWWYGGWYPGWGWYYPPYYTVSSYTTGTLMIAMADPTVDSPINRSQAAWIAAMSGVLTSSGNIDRILKAIDQSFQQSPYLKIN